MTKWPKWRAQGRKRSVGFKGLAREMLLLAVKDATGQKDERVRRDAYRFFQNSRMLCIYCELAEWDADYLMENIERLSDVETG